MNLRIYIRLSRKHKQINSQTRSNTNDKSEHNMCIISMPKVTNAGKHTHNDLNKLSIIQRKKKQVFIEEHAGGISRSSKSDGSFSLHPENSLNIVWEQITTIKPMLHQKTSLLSTKPIFQKAKHVPSLCQIYLSRLTKSMK